MELRDLVIFTTMIIGLGGLFYGIYVLIRLNLGAKQVTVNTPRGLLVMQTKVADDLQKRIDNLEEQIRVLEESHHEEEGTP